MKMIGRTAHKCAYGCCRGTGPKGRSSERRMLKRRERQKWKKWNNTVH